MSEPSMSLRDAQAAVNQKPMPRVTEQSIKEKIAVVEYLNPTIGKHLTICVITMKNGFMSVGTSAPANPDIFDKEIGQRYAFEDAFKPLWKHEGYLLCEQLRG